MSIWFKPFSVDDINAYQRDTLVSHLGIRYTEVGEDFLSATMPVDARTKQPAGILHGGASVALAETLGSTGANMVLDRDKKLAVGLEINANHIRAMREGEVHGIARPLHIGGTTQVWEIRVSDGEERLVCVSRITMAVLDKASLAKHSVP
ncbi:MAG TPA: hotdog fold thioesterase [Gammaproteobacteria bacterium]|nr:hotdog fold thioesterase [Gammaproteobacteria bacterium]